MISHMSWLHCFNSRGHPLFNIDNRTDFLMEQCAQVSHDMTDLSKRLEQEMVSGTEFPNTTWQNAEGGAIIVTEEEVNNMYAEKNAEYLLQQNQMRLRELCKLLSDASYYNSDMLANTDTCDKLREIHTSFVSNMSQSTQGTGPPAPPGGIRYKTLKQLSRPKVFKGRDIEMLAKKRKSRRRNYGDIMGLLSVNRTIQAVRQESEKNNNIGKTLRGKKRTSEWVMDQPNYDQEGWNLDSLDLAEPCYVSEDTKQALRDMIAQSDADISNLQDTCMIFLHFSLKIA